MHERVVPIPGGWEWNPNAPAAVLMSTDDGNAVLALRCHPTDEDRRTVLLRWHGAVAASMSGPNDEALNTHPLYAAGLRELMWVGEVEGSTWLNDAVYNRERFRHFIAPLKECVVEVLAERITQARSDAPPPAAAFRALVGNGPSSEVGR